MAEQATPLSPQQAAQALADIASFEEGLHARAGALTGVVWGLVSGAIFVTYGLAVQSDLPEWTMAVLWVPWTLVGILITVALWHLLSVSRRQAPRPRAAIAWIAATSGTFLAAIAALYLLDLEHAAFAYMTAVNAFVALGILVRISLEAGRLASVPLLLAAVVMGAGAFAIGLADLSITGAAFAAAAICCGSYAFAGLATFVRG